MQNSNSLTWNRSPKLILKWWEMCQPLCLVLVAWICEFWVIKSFKNAIQAFWKWSRSKNLAELYALHKWSLSPQRTHRGWQSAGSLQYPPLLIALQLPPADTLDGFTYSTNFTWSSFSLGYRLWFCGGSMFCSMRFLDRSFCMGNPIRVFFSFSKSTDPLLLFLAGGDTSRAGSPGFLRSALR